MCLIIRAEPQFRINQTLMDHFAERNNDGFGVMWIENNRIHAEKYGPTEMDRLYPTYQRLQDKEHWIHLRMRTHGDVNIEQSHPYYCDYGIWLMHNGVLNEVQGTDKTKSDTWYFIEDYLKPIFREVSNPHRLIRMPSFGLLLNRFLGASNKIVMGDRGGFVIFNQHLWHTITNENTGVQGMLVSNTYAWDAYNYGKAKTYYYNTGGYYKGGQQQTLPLGGGSTTSGTATSETTKTSGKSKLKFSEIIDRYFFNLGRHWYINRSGEVFKRTTNALKRRPDLDNSEQFWNQFSHDRITAGTVWMAEQNQQASANKQLPDDSSKIIRPKTLSTVVGPTTQLVLNWATMSEEEIRKHIQNNPAIAARTIHNLTHTFQ